MSLPEDWVFLHGWGMNAGVWAPFLTHLDEAIRPHCLNLPGHGGAPPAPTGDLRTWTEMLLNRAPQEASWVGWSLGGLLAQDAALRHPGRIRRLILVATTPRFLETADWPCGIARGTLANFHRDLLTDPAGTLHRFLALQLRGGERMRATLRLLETEIARHPPPRPEALAAGIELLRTSDLREDLGGLQVPSLWLFGERDTLVPAATAEYLGRLHPDAHTLVISKAAHAPFLSHPRAVVATLSAFREAHP